ncbi:MAG TPA: hypothetical protein VMS31_17140, partial [Pyrinomonadaceae bacterium]|nr:hypothetical protein [Pyrinomonadaceae bacterium]
MGIIAAHALARDEGVGGGGLAVARAGDIVHLGPDPLGHGDELGAALQALEAAGDEGLEPVGLALAARPEIGDDLGRQV